MIDFVDICSRCGNPTSKVYGVCEVCGAPLNTEEQIIDDDELLKEGMNDDVDDYQYPALYEEPINEIKPHSFETAIAEMQTFSESIPKKMTLSQFETKGGVFKFGKHKVTGDEMNNHVIELQKNLSEINGWVISLSNQFPVIYQAINALDKEYIQGIMESMETAENAQEQAEESIERLNKANEEINRTIAALGKTIAELKRFENEELNVNRRYEADNNELRRSVKELRDQINSNNNTRPTGGALPIIISIFAILVSVIEFIIFILMRG